MNRLLAVTAAACLAVASARPVCAQGPGAPTLRQGDAAPDFTVSSISGKQTVKLSELKGKPVVLIFGSCT